MMIIRGVHTQTETEKSRDFDRDRNLEIFCQRSHTRKNSRSLKKKIGSMGENRELRMPEIDLKVGPKPLDSPHTRAIHGAI